MSDVVTWKVKKLYKIEKNTNITTDIVRLQLKSLFKN